MQINAMPWEREWSTVTPVTFLLAVDTKYYKAIWKVKENSDEGESASIAILSKQKGTKHYDLCVMHISKGIPLIIMQVHPA